MGKGEAEAGHATEKRPSAGQEPPQARSDTEEAGAVPVDVVGKPIWETAFCYRG